MDLITKKCRKCEEDKSQFAFTLDNSMPDGLCQYCKVCKNHRSAKLAKKRPKRHLKEYPLNFRPDTNDIM